MKICSKETFLGGPVAEGLRGDNYDVGRGGGRADCGEAGEGRGGGFLVPLFFWFWVPFGPLVSLFGIEFGSFFVCDC